MGDVIHVDFRGDLSDSQRTHWLNRLEDAERAVALAKQVLGLLNENHGADKFDIFPDDEPA